MNHPDPVTQTRTIGGPRTLLEMCLDLRMAHNGSADPISEEETAAALAYLRHRLETWKPSVLPSGARFDECVFDLVLATIAEVAPVIERHVLALPEIQSPITDAAIDAAVAKADPLAGLPEAERLRILAGAANAMPDNRERFVANSVAAYHARQSGVGVAIGREGQWSPQSTGTHTFGGRLRSDCAPEMLNRAAAEEVLRTTWKLSEATIETMLSHCVVPTSFGEPVDNIVRAHARWLDAQKAAEEPAPRLASREVRYAAVMKVSAEIDAAAEREPQ